MRVLGIDPGSINTGFALLEVNGNNIKYLDSGLMKFDPKIELISRLSIIHNETKILFKNLKPDQISLESLIYVKSVSALSKLSQARGAMISAFGEEYKDKIFEYSPNLVKSTSVGHGHANKESVQKGLKMIFKEFKQRDFLSHDESDALAIALCHALNRGNTVQKGYQQSKKKHTSLKDLARNI